MFWVCRCRGNPRHPGVPGMSATAWQDYNYNNVKRSWRQPQPRRHNLAQPRGFSFSSSSLLFEFRFGFSSSSNKLVYTYPQICVLLYVGVRHLIQVSPSSRLPCNAAKSSPQFVVINANMSCGLRCVLFVAKQRVRSSRRHRHSIYVDTYIFVDRYYVYIRYK